MPLFIAALLGGLIEVAASLAGRVLIALSVGYVTYTGLSAGLSAVESLVWSNLSAASAQTLQVMGLMQIDTDLNIIFSAYAARLLLNGLSSGGAITKMIVK